MGEAFEIGNRSGRFHNIDLCRTNSKYIDTI